jgi:DeoR/GlpR family transcriptional regulator of sugar metabolism
MPLNFELKSKAQLPIKQAIADYVWENAISTARNPRIWIDAGSSAVEVAEAIRVGIDKTASREKGEQISATIVTNNLGAWERLKLCSGIELYLVGGRYNPLLNAIIELRTFEAAIERWYTDIVVIAVSGIDQDGLYCSNVQDEDPVKELLAKKKCERRIIIADDQKFGQTDVAQFAKLEALANNTDELWLVTNEVGAEHHTAKYKETVRIWQEFLGGNRNNKFVRVKPKVGGVHFGGRDASCLSCGIDGEREARKQTKTSEAGPHGTTKV